MKLPSTPQAWAIHLSQLVKIFHDAHGLDPFPIKVAPLAMEYSRQVFPDAPITMVDGKDFSPKFDGMLMPNPHVPGEWGIVYSLTTGVNSKIGARAGRYGSAVTASRRNEHEHAPPLYQFSGSRCA